VAGVTHALNAVADGLRLPLEFSQSARQPILPLPDAAETPELKAIFDEIVEFYALECPPAAFRWMACGSPDFSSRTGPRLVKPSGIGSSTA
jgi:hypothetical protein